MVKVVVLVIARRLQLLPCHLFRPKLNDLQYPLSPKLCNDLMSFKATVVRALNYLMLILCVTISWGDQNDQILMQWSMSSNTSRSAPSYQLRNKEQKTISCKLLDYDKVSDNIKIELLPSKNRLWFSLNLLDEDSQFQVKKWIDKVKMRDFITLKMRPGSTEEEGKQVYNIDIKNTSNTVVEDIKITGLLLIETTTYQSSDDPNPGGMKAGTNRTLDFRYIKIHQPDEPKLIPYRAISLVTDPFKLSNHSRTYELPIYDNHVTSSDPQNPVKLKTKRISTKQNQQLKGIAIRVYSKKRLLNVYYSSHETHRLIDNMVEGGATNCL